jgi:hypothetical protein
MSDEAPKSAYDLAMARLRQKDKDEGVAEREVTPEQKAKIAEIRQYYKAKLAEGEILHRATLRRNPDPEGAAQLDLEYRRDRERLASERDTKIEKVRAGRA